VLDQRLEVMDATAIVLCRDYNMPLCVLNINKPGALMNAMLGGHEGTYVR
jgi:uridylate kinase